MKTVERSETRKYKVYIASDGEEFSTPSACEEHENNKFKQAVFVVVEKNRGGDAFVAIFSTEPLAKKWIDSIDFDDKMSRFGIRPDYIDRVAV